MGRSDWNINLWQAPSIPNCQAWFRADRGITPSGSDVAAWADLSGNGRNATAPGNKPAYNASGWSNGHPTVDFAAASTEYLTFSMGTQTSYDWFVYAVYNLLSLSNQALLSCTAPPGLAAAACPSLFSGVYQVGGTDGAARVTGAASTGECRMEFHWNATAKTLTCYCNGVLIGTDGTILGNKAFTGASSIGRLQYVAAYYLNARVAEIAVYSALPSTADLAAIRAYGYARYGV